MKNNKKLIFIPLIGAVVMALALGLMAFSSGSASDAVLNIQAQEDDTEDPIPWKGVLGGLRGRKGVGHGGSFGFGTSFDYDAYIAEELGITVAELQASRQAAHKAALDQAVADGVITDEQAELIKAGQALRQYLDHQEILSQALGIDASDLEAAREEGKSLRDLVGEMGLEPEEFRAALQSAHEDAIQQAIDDGVITESQAEQLQENNLGKRGFGFHGRGGFHFQRPEPSADSDG